MPNTAEFSTISIKEFMAQEGFVSAHKTVRANSNTYPYVTFINANNEAENVYFSKNGAEMFHEGDSIIGMSAKVSVALVTNADGEKRWKLVTNSGNRVSADEI